jgi:hypothetical protein
MRTTLPRLPEYLAHGRIEWALEKFYQLRILRLDTSKSDDEAPLVLPKPPADGLERAGIKLA